MSARLRGTSLRHLVCCLCLLLIFPTLPAGADDRSWLPLAKDGLRDPGGPAVKVLQQPADALSPLAPDNAGNQVRWVRALRDGQINPRSSLRHPLNGEKYDKDVLLNLNGGMPVVRFPHSVHNEWLDCTNCHDHLFKKQRGATKISMFLILQGEQCGVCHGAVAFPLTECARCHSVKRSDALAELEREAAAKPSPTPPFEPAPTPSTRPSAGKTEGKAR
ncbi:hypothetical protein GPA26_08235 [Aromatoleum petrolei]|uniref:Cytochrome c7-like domain-containing protein n=1 Tax=Aromatoleum petrolei TaxID=76116 RepID=A0ABX1MKH8_9RHOO|nr:hypothetical protein [Aromatoleum petrolei]